MTQITTDNGIVTIKQCEDTITFRVCDLNYDDRERLINAIQRTPVKTLKY